MTLEQSSRHVIAIDDDAGLLSMFKWQFKSKHPDVTLHTASNAQEAIALLSTHVPDVVVLDLGLPPDPDNATEGLKILQAIRENKSRFAHTQVLAYSGSVRVEHARECARYDACFISKSGDHATLFSFIELMLSYATLKKEMVEHDFPASHPLLIGDSAALKTAIRKAERVSATDISVLLLGESGTGKELFARLLHEKSGRQGEFIALNCAAIPEDLLENELFGHEKGAFTGASSLKRGKVEQANGGTLFLDEIGDMPLALQSKILRFLQEGKIDRVGGTSAIPVDVRVVCATHRDLKKMIQHTQFRQDLYYRLAKMTIELPALREREQDSLILARFFLKEMSEKYPAFHATGFSSSAEQAILAYEWPGNIRELQNRIQSALISAESSLITATDLELPCKAPLFISAVLAEPVDAETCDIEDLHVMLAKFEHQLIARALKQSGGSVTLAAKALNISRTTLYGRLASNKQIFTEYRIGTSEPVESS